MRPPLPIACVVACLVAIACASPLERGEDLYRQGDLPGALRVWRAADADPRVEQRLSEVEGQLEQRLRRYEKRARFFEEQGRLAEAILYYRLALALDPDRGATLERVQKLARVLERRVEEERAMLRTALSEQQLFRASAHAQRLAALNPFDPSVLAETTQVRAKVGAEVLHNIEVGKQHYARGGTAQSRRAFEMVLALDEGNQVALGYLAYIRRFEQAGLRRGMPAPPGAISQEEILAEGHYRSARQSRDAGDDFRALSEYQTALRVNADHAAARRELDRLRGDMRHRVEELYEIGKRYFQDEDLHNALRVWRQVLLIDPGDERTRENVQRAERILSRLEELQTSGS